MHDHGQVDLAAFETAGVQQGRTTPIEPLRGLIANQLQQPRNAPRSAASWSS